MQITKEHRLPTGNDVVAIPSLSAGTLAAPDINVLSMKHRGMVELHGSDKAPFLKPLVRVGAKVHDFSKDKKLKVSRLEHWVPAFHSGDGKSYEIELRVVCPLGQRGFLYEYKVKNLTAKPLKVFLGAEGNWQGLRVRNNEASPLRLWRQAIQYGGLVSKHLVLCAGGESPEYAMAIGASEGELDVMEFAAGSAPKAKPKWGLRQAELAWDSPKGMFWQAGKQVEVPGKGTARFALTFGLGLEAVSAAATCVEMKRQGLDALIEPTLRFLSRRTKFTGDAHLDTLLNLNLWFNYFYAMGVTLDSEDFVCLTSRSPHYYVNGAYWDRDSMLWSFPAVLLADPQRARRMLEYAFGIQGRNIGVHSRFLDGAVLEPGFELDELCAPIIALGNYVKATGDQSLLKDSSVKRAIRHVEKTLQSKRHPSAALYETTSGPDDDFESLPYLAFDNALVWRMLQALIEIKPRMGRDKDVASHRDLAERVKSAVWKHLTAEGPRGRMFVWAADLRGNHRFYSSPAGCLQLLPYYGFCEPTEQVWRNTVSWLHSKEFNYSFEGAPFGELSCAHATQPWTLSICNSLLSGRRDRVKGLLEKLDFDGGVACEAFDSKTGKPFSGLAFATCAGFLSWSLWKAYGRAEGQSQHAPQPQAQQKSVPGGTVSVLPAAKTTPKKPRA